MDKLLSTFSPEFFSNVGMFVILLIIVFKDKILKFSPFNHRKEDKGNWFEKFIHATEEHTKATMESSREFSEAVKESSEASSNEIRNLANVIKNMSENMSKRADKALNQHEIILYEIEKLDVPRKRTPR